MEKTSFQHVKMHKNIFCFLKKYRYIGIFIQKIFHFFRQPEKRTLSAW